MITRRESLFVLSVIVGLLLLVTLPYILAARAGGDEYVFGGFLLNPLDGNSYLAKIFEGWQGDWRFTLPYTASTNQGAYLFLFYIFLGHLARLSNLSPLIVFHLARIMAAAFMLVALYKFCSAVLDKPRQRMLAFVLAALGSGLGWLVFVFGKFTADFWVAEAYPFLSSYTNPHFPLSIALILVVMTSVISRAGQFSLKGFLVYALIGWVLGVILPFGVVILLIVNFGLVGWDLLDQLSSRGGTSNLRNVFLTSLKCKASESFWGIFAGGVPVMLYDFLVVSRDPLLSIWNSQNITPSPPVWDTLIALSPVILLALPGAWFAIRGKQRRFRVLLVWSGLSLVLMYIPLGLQRRFMLGIYIPLALLAILGLEHLHNRVLKSWSFTFSAGLLFLFAMPTNFVILMAAQHGINTHDPALYLTHGEANAISWLNENTPNGTIILASPGTGLFIPAYSDNRVVYGHPFETVDAGIMEEKSAQFYRSGGAHLEQFTQLGVSYIFYGPRERALGGLDPQPVLKPVYQSGEVEIFKILKDTHQ
jgi:hypothetical protein